MQRAVREFRRCEVATTGLAIGTGNGRRGGYEGFEFFVGDRIGANIRTPRDCAKSRQQILDTCVIFELAG